MKSINNRSSAMKMALVPEVLMRTSTKSTAEKLCQFKSATPSHWRENVEARLAVQEERRKARQIAMQVLNAMDEQSINELTLAERMGVSVTDISPILKGHKVPTSSMMTNICSVLGITISTII